MFQARESIFFFAAIMHLSVFFSLHAAAIHHYSSIFKNNDEKKKKNMKEASVLLRSILSTKK